MYEAEDSHPSVVSHVPVDWGVLEVLGPTDGKRTPRKEWSRTATTTYFRSPLDRVPPSWCSGWKSNQSTSVGSSFGPCLLTQSTEGQVGLTGDR